jgi:hypothetical protein
LVETSLAASHDYEKRRQACALQSHSFIKPNNYSAILHMIEKHQLFSTPLHVIGQEKKSLLCAFYQHWRTELMTGDGV